MNSIILYINVFIYSRYNYIAGLLLIMLIILLPETLRKSPTPKSKQCINTYQERFVALKTMRNVFSPMVVMLKDPTVLLITLYNTVIYASLFFLVSAHG